MTSTSQRHKQYRTAAARRRANPFYLDVDEHDPIQTVDKMELAMLSEQIAAIQNPLPEGTTQIDGAMIRLEQLRAFIGEFVHPKDKRRWHDNVAPDLDEVTVLRDMMNDLITEYTGMDPTQRASSSEASPAPGSGSTVGAPPEASTPSTLTPPAA